MDKIITSHPSSGTTTEKSCGNPARLCWSCLGRAGLRGREKQCSEEGTILSRFTRSNPASFYSNTGIIFSISHISTVATQHGAGVEGCASPSPRLFPFLPRLQEPTLTTAQVLIHKPATPTNKRGRFWAEKPFFPLLC